MSHDNELVMAPNVKTVIYPVTDLDRIATATLSG